MLPKIITTHNTCFTSIIIGYFVSANIAQTLFDVEISLFFLVLLHSFPLWSFTVYSHFH